MLREGKGVANEGINKQSRRTIRRITRRVRDYQQRQRSSFKKNLKRCILLQNLK
jgi:hypothetical protein